MSRQGSITHQKLAEKLIVLNQRIVGLLTRLYNMKSTYSKANHRPTYLPGGEKGYEPVHKALLKKFPVIDQKSIPILSPLDNVMGNILSDLPVHYYTLVDVRDVKEHFTELLGRLSGSQVSLDITQNFQTTKNYLDLVANYAALMLLLSRIEDRFLIVSLYNYAFEKKNGLQEETFPRLSQMLVDLKTDALAQLHIELNPHAKSLGMALKSIQEVYTRRVVRAQTWSDKQLFSLLADASKMPQTTLVDMPECELLSIETMERWIVLGYLMIYPELSQPQASELWKTVLSNSYVVSLFRDEVLPIHPTAMVYFRNIKLMKTRVNDIRDLYSQVCANCYTVHLERRRYLRVAMKELILVLTNQPGLLGPKCFDVLMAMSYGRDEVSWLLKHASNVPTTKDLKISVELFEDPSIAELLYYVVELKELMLKNIGIVHVHYSKILMDYDSLKLEDLLKDISFPEEESDKLSSIMEQVKFVSPMVDEEGNELGYDFHFVRLDWFRVEACLSQGSAPVHLSNNKKLAHTMNSTIFHTRMLDSLEETVTECSDLSVFYFYQSLLDVFFQEALKRPVQHRFITVYPKLCTYFKRVCHVMCPEENFRNRETSFNQAVLFSRTICKEVCKLITMITGVQNKLNFDLLPAEAVLWISDVLDSKSGKSQLPLGQLPGGATIDRKGKGGGPRGTTLSPQKQLPGIESVRRYREDMTEADKYHTVLTILCSAINKTEEIMVWDHTITMKEVLLGELKASFLQKLTEVADYKPETKQILQPSKMWTCLMSYKMVLMNIENYVSVDIAALISEVLVEIGQPKDSYQGNPTLTAVYTKWYCQDFMPFVIAEDVIFSPQLKAFVLLNPDAPATIRPEHYTDFHELRCLVELIGPSGIRFMSERILREVALVVEDTKRLVLSNRRALENLVANKHTRSLQKVRELEAQIQSPDHLLTKLTAVGMMLSLRGLLMEALKDVMRHRAPFLMESTSALRTTYSTGGTLLPPTNQEDVPNYLGVSELTSTMGFSNPVLDTDLCTALTQAAPGSGPEESYQAGRLLPLFVAALLPRIAHWDACFYLPEMGGHVNNLHCIVPAVIALQAALFNISGHAEEMEIVWQNFLALASTSLLRLELELVKAQDSSSGLQPKSRDAVYVLFDKFVQQCPYLNHGQLEICFPYSLIRQAYHNIPPSSRWKGKR